MYRPFVRSSRRRRAAVREGDSVRYGFRCGGSVLEVSGRREREMSPAPGGGGYGAVVIGAAVGMYGGGGGVMLLGCRVLEVAFWMSVIDKAVDGIADRLGLLTDVLAVCTKLDGVDAVGTSRDVLSVNEECDGG